MILELIYHQNCFISCYSIYPVALTNAIIETIRIENLNPAE